MKKDQGLIYYFNAVNKMTVDELIFTLNNLSSKSKFSTLVLVTSRLIYLIYRNLISRLEKYDIFTSIIVSILILKLSTKEELTLSEILSIAEKEIYAGRVRDVDLSYFVLREPVYQRSQLDTLLLDDVREYLLKICPEYLKLAMKFYLMQGTVNTNNYSGIDKCVFNCCLKLAGARMEEVEFTEYNKLETYLEKAVFFALLKEKHPNLFAMAVEIEDFSKIYRLCSYGAVAGLDTKKFVLAVESTAEEAKKLVNKDNLSRLEINFYQKLIKGINSTLDTNISTNLNSIFDELYERYDKELKRTFDNTTDSVSKLKLITQTLNKETDSVLRLVKNIETIGG